MRAANPDDARAVWEALEAAGTKPTIRAVADALNASGQFTPVSPSTVHRWQQRTWKGVEKAGRPKSVANAPDLAAVALTGDPTSTRTDIAARADAEEVERLREMRTEELMALAGRESLVTLVLAQRQARDALYTLPPKQMGDLQKALSGSFLALVEADRIARQATVGVVQTSPAPISNGAAVEHDDLDPAWAAMRKMMANPPAECQECRRRAQDH